MNWLAQQCRTHGFAWQANAMMVSPELEAPAWYRLYAADDVSRPAW